MKRMQWRRIGSNKEWSLYPRDVEKSAYLAERLHIPEPVAQILINRGINTVEEGEAFLKPALSRLYSPFYMKDMEPAVELILQTLQKGKKIAVYGDYDADGITATALMVLLLQDLGGDVIHHIPSRFEEGYGLNRPALEDLSSRGVSLIITVDCGITSVEEVSYARQLEMDIIVTDHHQPREVLPPAAAVINPLRVDCSYPFKTLCGAGIAFKLGEAVLRKAAPGHEDKVEEYLDLAAIGTVADIVPLLGENRILVHHGLRKINEKPRPGLEALCRVAGLQGKQITAGEIGFILAPRLNAPGRLGDATFALQLLLEKDGKAALKIAEELQQKNTLRQEVETKIFVEASSLVDGEGLAERSSFLLLAREGWNPGVLGIVAGRLVEKYHLPVIMLALEDGMGKGSGRSCGDFDITGALKKCASLLLEYGGHRQACGLTVKEEFLPLLQEKMNGLARAFFDQGRVERVFAELLLKPEMITPRLVESLAALEPLGYGNPRPVFAGEDWSLVRKREVGRGGRHLQLGMQAGNYFFRGISFNGKNNLPSCEPLRKIDLLFSLSFDRWRGGENIQLEVHSLVGSGEYAGADLLIVDRRGEPGKRRFLARLLKNGQKTLIFVNTLGRLHDLKKSFASCKEAAFTHQGRNPRTGGNGPFHQLVLYDLPLDGDRLAELITLLLENIPQNEKLSVYLLYGERDFQDNLKLLRATIPSFSSLEQVYLSLQELACGGSIPVKHVSGKLREQLPFTITGPLVEKSLQIFCEASCLRLEKETLVLPGQKVQDYCSLLKSLSHTSSFRLEKEKWEHTLAWQRFFLESPGEKILTFFTSPASEPEGKTQGEV